MARTRPVDLNNIRYFVEVAERGSFSAAARFFAVPPSVISRRIARLEQETGARLFQRTTRAVRLTDAGMTFLTHSRAGILSFANAQQAVGASEGVLSGRVRVSASAGMAEALWTTLSMFLVTHPRVRMELEIADRYVDLVQEGVDVAIRSGPAIRGDSLVGRRLTDSPRWLFASPGYLEHHGRPRSTRDLKSHTCIVLGTRADRVTWTLYTGKRKEKVLLDGRIAVNEARLGAKCAADGFGIALLPVRVCANLVEMGKLQRVLPRTSGGESGLWLIYPDRHLPPATRGVVDHLAAHLMSAVTGQTTP